MHPQAPPLIENLVTLLGEEHEIYGELAGVLELEHAALLAMEVSELGVCTSRKETLALRLRALDESRRLIAGRLATLLGVPKEAVTITRLCGAAGGAASVRLQLAAERLKMVVQRCHELNQVNSIAARKGLELASGAIQFLLAPPDPAGRVYQSPRGGARGYAAAGSRPAQAPGLISRQV